ncbi:hypothetical protein OAQ39_02145 [Alphaproteobacteria bacterium]|nr:hypothetical protein [Alphaproteobacteria bacterium]
MDVGIHLIYITLYLFGEIQTKYLYLDNNEIKNNIDDNGFLHLKTKNNISINLNFSLTHWENRFNYKIIFERGMIEICGLPKWSKQKLIISSRVYPSGKPKKKYLYSSIDKSFEKEMINLKNILEIKKNKLSIFNNKDFSVLQTMKNSLNKNLDNLSIKYFNEK